MVPEMEAFGKAYGFSPGLARLRGFEPSGVGGVFTLVAPTAVFTARQSRNEIPNSNVCALWCPPTLLATGWIHHRGHRGAQRSSFYSDPNCGPKFFLAN